MSPQSRYTILRKIADGGMAEIFLANQHGAQGFEKTVVLKRILTTFYADPQFRNMLVDEAHISMSLNHSNIVQVLDLGVGGRALLPGARAGRRLGRSTRSCSAPKAAGVPVPPALALYVDGRGLPRAGLRARRRPRRQAAGDRPPRHQPAQRAAQRAGRGEADRLRHREGADASASRARATSSRARSRSCRPSRRTGSDSTRGRISSRVGTMLYVMIARRAAVRRADRLRDADAGAAPATSCRPRRRGRAWTPSSTA